MDQVSSIVPSRAERTRRALLMAGLDLLASRSIDAIPIDDIVAAAGVAKGSFFNHFVDKQAFGAAVSAFVRAGLERRIDAVNGGVADPVQRLANGMAVAADFAFVERSKAIIMLRGMAHATVTANALNRGIEADMAACIAAGVTRAAARQSGVVYWLGLCQILMMTIVEADFSRDAMAERLGEMLLLGLCGLGIDREVASKIAAQGAEAQRIGDTDPVAASG